MEFEKAPPNIFKFISGPKRTRGQKSPPNLVRVAIMLYITGNNTRSAHDIRDYLRTIHNVREPRGVRKYLYELHEEGYLDKTVNPGIDSYYTWRKGDFESFRKVINLLSENTDLIKQIIQIHYKKKRLLGKKLKGFEPIQERKLYDTSVKFDATKFWYSTKFTKSFLNEDTIEYFIDKAYDVCSHDSAYRDYVRQAKQEHTRELFKVIMFEGYDNKEILTLMNYSPRLVLFIANLEEQYQIMTVDLKRRKDIIFQMVAKDILTGSYISHGQGYFLNCMIEKRLSDKGKFEGVDLTLKCPLSYEQTDSIHQTMGVD